MAPKSFFLGFPCTKCSRPIKTFAMSEGRPTPSFKQRQNIDVRCPWCGEDGKYSTDDIQPFEVIG